MVQIVKSVRLFCINLLYMIDEQDQESCMKISTRFYTFYTAKLKQELYTFLQIIVACRGFAIRANHAERTREPS